MLQRTPQPSRDRFGRFTESFARGMGTSGFLIGMTVFVLVWLGWNIVHAARRCSSTRPRTTSRC